MDPAEFLDDVAVRTTLVEHLGKSGAALERVTLGDGRTVIVKRITPDTDLTLALFDQPVAQELVLWRSGALDRLPEQVGHVILDGWVEGEDTTVIVMRDLGDTVLTWEDRLDAGQCRWMLERVAALHRAYLGDPPEAVAALAPALELFAPARITELARQGSGLFEVALRGWEYFADPDLVPSDVSDAVFALLADAHPLVRALASGPVTLAHGDLATVNMAFEGDQLVLLDWAMPLAAPGAFDIGRFLVGCGHVVDLPPDEILAEYRRLAGAAYDERSMQFALLAALCWLGWNKTLDIVESDDEAVRERERVSLTWWIRHAREAIEKGAW
ncbi:hypothetical protein [Nocardioides sp.]|uniref:hypothetical protein n=1 Tax=Nocardioides sp. TaxID=35761 RepID=UPI002ED4844E